MGARVHLCGQLRVEWDGERLEEALPGRQGRLLFAYLTLHRERLVRRDELVEALWSDGASSPAGDALLRPPLSRLRRALGDGRLDGRGELAVRFPQDTWIDREFVRDALRLSRAAGDARASWETAREALAIAERGLLPGVEARWLAPFRAELDQQRVELLELIARAGARLGDGELAEAEQAARRAVELAPFRESARVAQLELLRRRGNVAEALVAFDEFRVFLRDELGAAPGRELLALHEELLRADGPARTTTPAAASGPPAGQRLPDRLAQSLAAPWVGRAGALARLREEADRAAAGETKLVLVVGEGGIGKTRLVAELAAGLTGFDVLYGRCDEEELFPYGAFVDMLRPRLARMGEDELAAVLGGEAADVARLAPELRERLPDVAGTPAAGDPETERRLLFEAIARVIGRLARQRPLLAVIDDLHWADRSSMLLARHLARQPNLGPVLLVGTFRDTELEDGHPLPALVADVERDRPVPRVRLTGMDESEVGLLIGSWHGTEAPRDAVRAIRVETQGNPFFVKQLVRHLEEVGGSESLAPRDGLGVPESVREVIGRRVSRLPPRAGHVLRVAALIGRDFEFDLLERVSDVPADELLDVLDAAVRGALIAEVPSTPGRYSFAHALLRSAIEADVSATRRALLHRRIGEAIEQRHGGRLEPWLDDLARHFAEAGPHESDRAVDYAVRAAAQASERLAHEEAARLLTQAISLRRRGGAVDPPELTRLELALATAEAGAGHWERARGSFARAADAARAAGVATTFADAALGHSGGTWEHWGRYDEASAALLEEALDRLPAGDGAVRVRLLARLAVLRYWSAAITWEQLQDVADEAVAIARRLGDPEALVAALAAAQHARWRPGRRDDRLSIVEELIEQAERHGLLAAAAEAHLYRAGVLLERCDLDGTAPHFRRVDEIADHTRQHQLLGVRLCMRSMRALLAGDHETGVTAAEEALEWGSGGRTSAGAPMPMFAQMYWAAMLTSLNERDELGRLAPLAERLVDEIGALPGWRVALSWAYVQDGRRATARATLEAVSADGYAMLPRDSNFLPSMAMAAHAIWELEDAALAARSAPLLAPFTELWVVFGIGAATLGPAAYSLGLLELLQDRPDEAAATFEIALERSTRMRARPYVARSRAGLADALRRRGGPGDAARAEELSVLAAIDARQLGMTRLQRELAVGSR